MPGLVSDSDYISEESGESDHDDPISRRARRMAASSQLPHVPHSEAHPRPMCSLPPIDLLQDRTTTPRDGYADAMRPAGRHRQLGVKLSHQRNIAEAAHMTAGEYESRPSVRIENDVDGVGTGPSDHGVAPISRHLRSETQFKAEMQYRGTLHAHCRY